MFLSIAFDVVIAVLILYRQSRIRPVPRFLRLRMPIFLGAIGIVEILDYTHDHHISTGGFWLVMGGCPREPVELICLVRSPGFASCETNSVVVHRSISEPSSNPSI